MTPDDARPTDDRSRAPDGARADDDPPEHGRILSVHLGRSANCSSVGSVVDFLFLSTVAGSAVLAAVTAALAGRGGDDEERQADPEDEVAAEESRAGAR